MNLSRLKRLWELSRKDPIALKKLQNLTDEQLEVIPEVGDGKAVFFKPATEEDFKEHEKENKGLKGVFGL